MVCIYGCNNGKIFVPQTGLEEPCPECSTHVESVQLATEEQIKEIRDKLIIPDDYDVTDMADASVFDTPFISKTYTPESIRATKAFISDIFQRMYNQRVGSKHSVYLHAPSVDIKRVLYSYLLRAYEEGLTVAPLISVNMLYTIQKCRDHDFEEYDKVYTGKKHRRTLDNRAQQFYEGYVLMRELEIDYYLLLTADVLILEATANTTNVSFTALADILAEREIRNKATIVLGYWSSSQLNSSMGLTYILQPRDWQQPRKNKLMPVELVSNKKASTSPTFANSNYGGEPSQLENRGGYQSQPRQQYSQPPQYNQPQASPDVVKQHIQSSTGQRQQHPNDGLGI